MKLIKLQKTHTLLEKTIPLIILFILVLFLSILLEYLLPNHNLSGIYIISLIIAGCAFWKSISLQVTVAGLLTCLRYYFLPSGFPGIGEALFQGFTCILAILFVSTFVRFYLKEKENTRNLIFALAKSLDSRDPHTAHHSENVAAYALQIAKEMKLTDKHCEHIYLGGLLHDIGKIGIPESILTKPSTLTATEFHTIKQHPTIGYNIVKHIPSFHQNGILEMILYHHERYDGNGYPSGLKGEQIPLEARILSIADSFDAMVSKRVYRNKMHLDDALDQIKENKYTQFDPKITDIFFTMIKRRGKGESPKT